MDYTNTIRLKREEMDRTRTFACGTRVRFIAGNSYETIDEHGKHIQYLTNENVEIVGTIAEQNSRSRN